MKLLTLKQAKLDKSNNYSDQFLTAFHHMAQHTLSGWNLCPDESGCAAFCVGKQGRARIFHDMIVGSRIIKTTHFMLGRDGYLDQLNDDIQWFIDYAIKRELFPAMRLNATSDIPWHRFIDMEQYLCQFYDYTAAPYDPNRILPYNYHLTFSRKFDTPIAEIKRTLDAGQNMAICFDVLPATWLGYKVNNGTKHDLTFIHAPGEITGLLPVGTAKHDTTGFVVRLAS